MLRRSFPTSLGALVEWRFRILQSSGFMVLGFQGLRKGLGVLEFRVYGFWLRVLGFTQEFRGLRV